MTKRGSGRLLRWYKKLTSLFRSPKISDYRTTSSVERLYHGGALQNQRLTGNPLVRSGK